MERHGSAERHRPVHDLGLADPAGLPAVLAGRALDPRSGRRRELRVEAPAAQEVPDRRGRERSGRAQRRDRRPRHAGRARRRHGRSADAADGGGNEQPRCSIRRPRCRRAPTTSQWLRYPTVAAGASDPWGIAYQHASLLEPVAGLSVTARSSQATACTDNTPCTGGGGDQCVFPGNLGTARLQADAAYFLKSNE